MIWIIAITLGSMAYAIVDWVFGGALPVMPEIFGLVVAIGCLLFTKLFSTPYRPPSIDVPSMRGTARDGYTQDRACECWSDGCGRLTLPGEIVCPTCRDRNRRQEEFLSDLEKRARL